MAGQQAYPTLETLRRLEASLSAEARPGSRARNERNNAPASGSSLLLGAWLISLATNIRFSSWSPRWRKLAIAMAALGGTGLLAAAVLSWRLSSGPIELDIVTPLLTAAIKQNFGPAYRVDVGGTQLERDANGRTSLRIRDIVVLDGDGNVVASAPKAEVGISGWTLLTGRIRAERLSLVGAEMALRIELDSAVTVFAGGNKRPLVTAAAPSVTGSTPAAANAATASPALQSVSPGSEAMTRAAAPDLAALLAWIETLDVGALDGQDLTEIGLKGGTLSIDDRRKEKQWTFSNIDLSVTRPKDG